MRWDGIPANNHGGFPVSLRSTILASACAVALGVLSGPAFADMSGMSGFSGVLTGDYANYSESGGGGSLNSWGGSGAGMFGFGSEFAGQVNAGYHNISGDGLSADDWNVGGSVFWNGMQGRIGAVVGYSSASGGGNSGNVTNYGGFGEWYAGSMFTLGVKGGALSGSGLGGSDYLGAAATFYAMPDLSFTGGYDYDSFGHGDGTANTWSIQAEWLVSERTPVSIYGGYANTKISGFPTISTWSAGLKIYTDPVGPAPLVERQRTGVEQWGTSTGPISSLVGIL
jgi:hypothetical protein